MEKHPANESSLWWHVQSRNKRSVVLDLRTSEGQQAAIELATEADIVIENFTPGTLESWGLGWETLRHLNPRLIMLRISGYGQDGPYRDLPGFGAMAEAMGGIRHLTGEPGRLPVRTGIALGDTLAGLHGAIGVMLALYHRDVNRGTGQMIDVALYESVFNCTDTLVTEYCAFGDVRGPAGSALPGVAPTNAYRCLDGVVTIAGNGDRIFARLMELIGRSDLAQDAALATNAGRVARPGELDDAIGLWARSRTLDDALQELARAGVPASRIYTAKDIAEDPHYRARNMIESIQVGEGRSLQLPGIVPKLSDTPGIHHSPAPRLGEHTEETLRNGGWD